MVVEQGGEPIPKIKIREVWQYFGLDIAPWEDSSRLTNAQGRAQFPRRVSWLSLARRATMWTNSPNEPVGPSFFIQACDENHLQEAKFFWDGNKYWNQPRHEGITMLVATPVKQCSELD
jgi:hypothetical protein